MAAFHQPKQKRKLEQRGFTMDWPLEDPKFDGGDVEELFEYEPRESRVVRCLADEEVFSPTSKFSTASSLLTSFRISRNVL